jgi:hypothetical protein
MALQGRVNATVSCLVTGMLPLGALAGGALGQVLGLRVTITLAAVGSVLSCLWVVCSPVRDLVRIPETASPAATDLAGSAGHRDKEACIGDL